MRWPCRPAGQPAPPQRPAPTAAPAPHHPTPTSPAPGCRGRARRSQLPCRCRTGGCTGGREGWTPRRGGCRTRCASCPSTRWMCRGSRPCMRGLMGPGPQGTSPGGTVCRRDRLAQAGTLRASKEVGGGSGEAVRREQRLRGGAQRASSAVRRAPSLPGVNRLKALLKGGSGGRGRGGGGLDLGALGLGGGGLREGGGLGASGPRGGGAGESRAG